MESYRGKGVYGAVAIGRAYVYKRQPANVHRIPIDDPAKELERITRAKTLAKNQLRAIYSKALEDAGEAAAEIFSLHIMMLEDEDYNASIRNIIETQKVNAEFAAAVTSEHFAEMFAGMEDAYMQARAADVRDISNRLIACMNGETAGTDDGSGTMIVCAHDLSPSETVSLDKARVLAFVTAFGTSNSHTAILARSMGIPAVVGVGADLLRTVQDGMTLIADGHTGEVYLSPDAGTLARLEAKQADDLRENQCRQALQGMENITLDGRKIDIFANISDAGGIRDALANDAGGIGLFRTEFLYLESEGHPTEEQQFTVYRRVLEDMAGKKVVIRTLDIGADKQTGYFGLDKEDNPALGLRGIRLCLTRPAIFRTQLRALFRASVFGKLGIMFPMITSVSEVEQCLAICEQVKQELQTAGIPFRVDTEIGIMIETPAAAIISDQITPLVDFLSVGTNDLTQYTLACDRQNAKLEMFADAHHTAVLRLIELAANNAHANGAWIGVCGELAADVSMTETFLRMGIDELSVSPPFILPLREKVRSLSLS